MFNPDIDVNLKFTKSSSGKNEIMEKYLRSEENMGQSWSIW